MSVMGVRRFSTTIVAGPRGDGVVVVAFDPDEAWGAKAVHHVNGTVGGCRVRQTLSPGPEGWAFTLNSARMLQLGLAVGDEVAVELAPEGPQRAPLTTGLLGDRVIRT
jgi:hypothetical protein